MRTFHNNFNDNPTFSNFNSLFHIDCPKGVTGPMPSKNPTDDIMTAWINNEPLMTSSIIKFQNYDSLSLEDNLSLSNVTKLESIGDSRYDKQYLIYQLMHNLTDENSDINSLDNQWVKNFKQSHHNPNCMRFNILRCADYVTHCRIKIPKLCNLTDFYNTNIRFYIGDNILFNGSIKFIIAMNDYVGTYKMTSDDDYYIIPLCIFKLIGFNNINLIQLPYANLIFEIEKYYDDLIIEVMYGYYITELRLKLVRETLTNFLVMKVSRECDYTYIINNYISQFECNLQYINQGIIIWYEANDINNQLHPIILKIEVEIKYDDKYFNKEIELCEIKRLKCYDQIGFFIPTNRFTFDQLTIFLKQLNSKTDLTIFDDFINWTAINTTFKIHWSNYEVGSTISIEKCCLNICNCTMGLFSYRYSN